MQPRGGRGAQAGAHGSNDPSSMPGLGGESPEALLAMLEAFQAQGGNMKDVPPDLAELLRSVKREKGQVNEDVAAEDVVPTPGFVIKTTDQEGRKVFINMCGSDKVAAPGNWANGRMPDDVAAALDNVENLSNAQGDTLRFPLSLGPVQLDLDRKGQPCSTYDIILNGDVIKQAATYRPLKSFLITTALSWVGHKAGVELSVKYKLPKMRHKGEEVQSQRIRVDKKPLVVEVCDVEEDPVFPLVTKKLPASKAAVPLEASATVGAGGGVAVLGSGAVAAGAASAGSSSAVQAGGGSASRAPVGLQELSYVLSYVGRPVDRIDIEITAPAGVSLGMPTESATAEGVAGSTAAVGGSSSGSSSSSSTGLPRVEVCGRSVYVSAAGCRDLHITLPLAVTAAGASVSVGLTTGLDASAGSSGSSSKTGQGSGSGGSSITAGGGAIKAGQLGKMAGAGITAAAGLSVLRLQLPYLPLSELVEGMVRDKPFALGDLSLGDTSYLELDP